MPWRMEYESWRDSSEMEYAACLDRRHQIPAVC